MKNNFKSFLTIFFLIGFGVLLTLTQRIICQGPAPEADTIIEYETTFVNKPTYKPLPVSVLVPSKPIVDTFFTPKDTILQIDTVKIIVDYFSKVFYSDTITNDSISKIVIHDTIFQNRIFSRKPEVEIYNKNTIIYKTKPAVYIGGGVLLMKDKRAMEINLTHTRQKWAFSTGMTSDGQLVLRVQYRFY